MEAMKSKILNVINENKNPDLAEKGKDVLITGGSGFVAAHVLNAFCSRGYNGKIYLKKTMNQLNTSSAEIYRLMNGTEKQVPETTFYAFVDVR